MMTTSTRYLRFNLFIVSLIFVLVVFLGSGVNDKGYKYSRVSSEGRHGCKREIFIRNLPDSLMCCDKHLHHHDWACVAASDSSTKLLASSWAFILPFIPWLVNILADVAMKSDLSLKVVTIYLKRFAIHLGLLLFRTYVLYYSAHHFYKKSAGEMSQNCWYADYTRNKRCKDFFDFSDHLVIFYSQYILSAVIEYSYTSASSALSKTPRTASTIRRLVSLIASGSIGALCLRSAFFTAAYFHTPAESFAGTAIAVLSSGLIVYHLAASSYWIQLVSCS